MQLKTKITLGFVAMLALLLGIGGYAYFAVQRLDANSRTILRANFYTIELGQQMLRALDHMETAPEAPDALPQFERALTREAGNLTEPGEQALVDSLTQNLATYQRLLVTAPAAAQLTQLERLRRQTHRVIDLNVQALTAKNSASNQATERASRYLLACISLALLVGLGLVLSVPEAAVTPLRKVTAAIRHASRGNYHQTIPVESHDEFGTVASAFNHLLIQLQEFRASTTADLITERNRMESLVNSLDEGLLLIDQHRRILLANPTAAELLGVPAAQLVGQPADELAQQNDLLRSLLAPLEAPRRQQALAEAPLLTITQHNEEAYFRLTVHDIVSFNKAADEMQFVGHILALRNVSDFKRLDQVKSNFLATVSHELKTPLSSMNINLRLLQDERLPAEERQRITGSIRQETQRLQRMVSELLDVSRLDAGAGIQLDVHPTDISQVVSYATDTVQAQLNDKRLHLEINLPSNLPQALADVEKTTWVLINLLANAIRYSPTGETLLVRAAVVGAAVQVCVQDRGPGIAAEHHDRIFQRFAQIPDKSGYRGGSGLGLSIAREFITSQGGRLWVESELGMGSTFCFTLPLAS
ncbi:HAMP domain-containing sensor histidine kinase [Hymenobacter fodinae]|uniref:histidine kinase n=1 Tax=Hymenobacter fodinae TaxID=2510796 RepID=A0A4Z0P7D8_9BACT|nr:ATP-binding protein [Hymenobacter fodinae]TGE07855.1 HAMP domain-containing protein [Hymenobacter fodinae]